jgi:hypothetical protein
MALANWTKTQSTSELFRMLDGDLERGEDGQADLWGPDEWRAMREALEAIRDRHFAYDEEVRS